MFNAYSVLRPSFLLLTDSSEYRQDAPLSLIDITAARNALASLSHNHLIKSSDAEDKQIAGWMVIYNCGPAAGCSRLHRHMQIFPYPDYQLFPDRPTDNSATVPYICNLIRHPSSISHLSEISNHIFESYTAALDQFRGLLGIGCKDEPVPHNLVMTGGWTVIIPRRTAQVDGISANAAGMMGMVWVETEDKFEQWNKLGPSWVLGKLGLGASLDTPRE